MIKKVIAFLAAVLGKTGETGIDVQDPYERKLNESRSDRKRRKIVSNQGIARGFYCDFDFPTRPSPDRNASGSAVQLGERTQHLGPLPSRHIPRKFAVPQGTGGFLLEDI